MQQEASYREYNKLESEINALKQKGNSHRGPLHLLVGWYHIAPPFVWQIFVIILWWYFCLQGFLLWQRRRYLFLSVGILFFVIGSHAVACYYDEQVHKHAVVMSEQPLLRIGPHEDDPFVDSVHYLDEVAVLAILCNGYHEEWAQVSLRNKQGWLNVKNIVIL
jgi:hypothetical protein